MAFISSQYFFISDQFMQWSRKSGCKDWCVSFWDASSPVSWGFINCLMAGNGMKKSGASLISAGSSWEMVPFNQWWKLVQLQQSTRIGWILLLECSFLLLLAAVYQEWNREAPVLTVTDLSVLLLVVSLHNPRQCLCAAPCQGGSPTGINFSSKSNWFVVPPRKKGEKPFCIRASVSTSAQCEIEIICI